jgi:transcriptional regulator with XRE-family HTH domain
MYALGVFFFILQFYIVNNVKNIEYMKAFGKHLQKLRNSKNFTQELLSYEANIPISQIGRIERGEINTTISTIKAIASALDISPKELFDFE